MQKKQKNNEGWNGNVFLKRLFIKIFSWLGVRYFPEYMNEWDLIPLSFLVGLVGIGNVVDVIAKNTE